MFTPTVECADGTPFLFYRLIERLADEAPEKKEIRVGFIPLTDCASVVMAAVKHFDQKYGIKIQKYGIKMIPSKEARQRPVSPGLLVIGEVVSLYRAPAIVAEMPTEALTA